MVSASVRWLEFLLLASTLLPIDTIPASAFAEHYSFLQGSATLAKSRPIHHDREDLIAVATGTEVVEPFSALVWMFHDEWWQAFGQSWFVIMTAEMFDKTWFITLLYTFKVGHRLTLFSAFLALAVHTPIAAVLGKTVSLFIPNWLLHFITAAVFLTFAAFYAYECYSADSSTNAVESRKQEAEKELEDAIEARTTADSFREAYASSWEMPASEDRSVTFRAGFAQVFVAVFLAEWGDRTQVAMISLHASLPLFAVVSGSLLAFFLSALTATLCGTLMQGLKLSERSISGASSASFLVFGVLAALQGAFDLRRLKR